MGEGCKLKAFMDNESIEVEGTEASVREKVIGKISYFVTSTYSGDKELSELLMKAIEREAEI